MFSDVLSHLLTDVLKMCSDDVRSLDMFSEDHKCWILDFLQIFSRRSLDVLRMFSGYSQDFPRIFSRCFDGPCESGGSEGSGWSFWSSGFGGSGGPNNESVSLGRSVVLFLAFTGIGSKHCQRHNGPEG